VDGYDYETGVTERVERAECESRPPSLSGYAHEADDWYVEPPWIVDALLHMETFDGLIWDPAAGAGNIPKRCHVLGLEAVGTDLHDRGFGTPFVDFLGTKNAACGAQSIISNPPFDIAEAWSATRSKSCPARWPSWPGCNFLRASSAVHCSRRPRWPGFSYRAVA
jgi:hypothetical protein